MPKYKEKTERKKRDSDRVPHKSTSKEAKTRPLSQENYDKLTLGRLGCQRKILGVPGTAFPEKLYAAYVPLDTKKLVPVASAR